VYRCQCTWVDQFEALHCSYGNLAMLKEAREYNAYCKYDRSEKAPRDRCASAKAWALD
jgi:hypothetical protein